jgi:hypothetical protein
MSVRAQAFDRPADCMRQLGGICRTHSKGVNIEATEYIPASGPRLVAREFGAIDALPEQPLCPSVMALMREHACQVASGASNEVTAILQTFPAWSECRLIGARIAAAASPCSYRRSPGLTQSGRASTGVCGAPASSARAGSLATHQLIAL